MKLKVLAFSAFVLIMVSARGFCDWTPLQVQVYPSVAVPPAADVTGLSLNIFGVSGQVYGVQISGLTFTGSVYGLQLGGYNRVGEGIYGMQAGAVNVTAGMRGLQLGLYNRARDVSGVQIGLFNYCERTLKGVQIGFANVGGANALLPYSLGINIGF